MPPILNHYSHCKGKVSTQDFAIQDYVLHDIKIAFVKLRKASKNKLDSKNDQNPMRALKEMFFSLLIISTLFLQRAISDIFPKHPSP